MAAPGSKTRRHLGLADQGRVVSADEFADADFDEPWTYEREAGRLLVMSPEGQRHVAASSPWLKSLVGYWLHHGDVVELVVPQAWVRPDDDTDRIGDLGVYLLRAEGSPPIPDRVPDTMFEMVSPGRAARERDYVKKRREYYRLGVREYVVVDPKAKQVTIFTRGQGRYRQRVLTPADVYDSPLLPGLAIPLGEVF